MRSSRARRRCSAPWAERSPAIVAPRSSAFPSTLTYTRAWRRSEVVLTLVIVTKPIRGSCRSWATASVSTCLTASSTRRIRSEGILVRYLGEGGERALDPAGLGKAREQELLDAVGRVLEHAE